MHEWIRFPLLAGMALVGTFGIAGSTTASAPASRRMTMGTCPPDVCGRNSAELEALPLEELDLDGVQPSRTGFTITYARLDDGNQYPLPSSDVTLDVVNGLLVANRGRRVLALGISRGDSEVLVGFKQLRAVRSWARRKGCDPEDDRTHGRLECYELAYSLRVETSSPGGNEASSKTVCAEVPGWGVRQNSVPYSVARIKGTAAPGPMFSVPLPDIVIEPQDEPTANALLIKGELYDYEHATVVEPRPPGRWFNIACAGSAIGKMKLLGYDPDARRAGWQTTPEQRQATLKMLTASYCPGVRAGTFTQTGQSFGFQNRALWFAPIGAKSKIEAYWDQAGAMCLGQPRSPKWRAATKKIRTMCGLPACSAPATWPINKTKGDASKASAGKTDASRSVESFETAEWVTYSP